MTDANDMHEHRRAHDTEDTPGHRLQAAVDSTFVKSMSRLLIPILLTVIGFYLQSDRNTNEKWRDDQGQKMEHLSDQVGSTRNDVLVMRTQMSAQVIRQIDSNTAILADHEKRLQTVERWTKTP